MLHAIFEAVPAERRGVRPAPDRWSPAEIVHHVAIVERRLVQRLASLIDQAREIPPENDTSPLLSTLRTSKVVDRTKRLVTSEAAEPRNTNVSSVWDDFEQTRRELKDVIVKGEGLALGAVSASHPALGEFNGYA
jgi:hypothetical protein